MDSGYPIFFSYKTCLLAQPVFGLSAFGCMAASIQPVLTWCRPASSESKYSLKLLPCKEVSFNECLNGKAFASRPYAQTCRKTQTHIHSCKKHTHTHIHVHAYTRIYTNIHTHTCIYKYKRTCTQTPIKPTNLHA